MNDKHSVSRRTVLAAASVAAIGGPVLFGCAPAPSSIPIRIYKDAGCGCCKLWVATLEAAGFFATVEDRTDLVALKQNLGVPHDLTSCHTATMDRYVIEGHVPAADIKRLLVEKPGARGLSVPGMPVGSPGMEVDGEPADAFTVWLFQDGGQRAAFAQHGG